MTRIVRELGSALCARKLPILVFRVMLHTGTQAGTPRTEARGWSKAAELAKVARRNPEQFESANWLHRAKTTLTQQFKEEVEKYLTGSSEPSELIYFKVYKSQVPVIEQALESADRMLGSDKSRGYCLEMICADFLAGANLDNGNPDVLLMSLERFFGFLPSPQQQRFLDKMRRSA